MKQWLIVLMCLCCVLGVVVLSACGPSTPDGADGEGAVEPPPPGMEGDGAPAPGTEGGGGGEGEKPDEGAPAPE